MKHVLCGQSSFMSHASPSEGPPAQALDDADVAILGETEAELRAALTGDDAGVVHRQLAAVDLADRRRRRRGKGQ